MSSEKRQFPRHKCKKLASLICEKDNLDDTQYMSVWIVDQSADGMCISSPDQIDTEAFLTVNAESDASNESYPAEFVWMHKDKKVYRAGLKKI